MSCSLYDVYANAMYDLDDDDAVVCLLRLISFIKLPASCILHVGHF